MSESSVRRVDPATPLVVDELTISFPGRSRPVVDHVSLTLRSGEIVALVGESGSGKSLTARAVVGLLPDAARASGAVTVAGRSVLGAGESELRQIRGKTVAMVFQEPQTALNPVRTIGWQLAQALRAHGRLSRTALRSRVVQLLAAVEIPEPEKRAGWYPHQLSGGQKQRVVIALALANEPRVLLADEPTTALDVTVQAEILALLRRLRERLDLSILLITHNLGVVADIADRVIVMRRGRVVEQREVRQLFAGPHTQYARDLLAAVPHLPDRRTAALERSGAADERTAVADGRRDAAGPPLLSLQSVSVIYPGRLGGKDFRALSAVDVEVHPGEVVGLVGESGSGKTTLGRVALGLIRPTTGRVLLDVDDLAKIGGPRRRALRREIGLVPQDPAASLDPRRTVGESVAEPLRVHRIVQGEQLRVRVAELLESVRLPRDFAERLPAQLSGGQRQRVALARALALSPRLLVADEPTSALDVSVQAEVLDLFAELRERWGFACLFVSHDLAVVHQVADRVVVLRGGEIVESGSAAAVFAEPQHDYTRRLVAAAPVPDPVRQRLRRSGSVDPAPGELRPAV